MKKVLHVTLFLDIGGLERMVLLLSRGQRASGWQPHVFVYGKGTGALAPQFEAAGIPLRFAPKGRRFSLRLPFRILLHARRNGISLLHSHDLGALIYSSIASFLSLGRLRVVHTQHSFLHLHELKPRVYERIFPWFAGRLVCVSEDIRRTYLDLGQPYERLRLVPNGVDFQRAPANQTERDDLRAELLRRHHLPPELRSRKWVLALGRLASVKGPRRALEAWNRAQTEGATLFFVGPESEPGLLSELRGRAGPDVVFAGATFEPDAWLGAADLFVSCSDFEGLPLAALEAAGKRLPMLLTDIPGHALFQGWAAFFPPGDPARAAAALQKFLETGRAGENTGSAEVLERLERDGGVGLMTERYRKIYEELGE